MQYEKRERRPVDTGEPLPYIEVTDAADALSKQTASRGTTAKHQWKTARKYCTFRKNEKKKNVRRHWNGLPVIMVHSSE